MPWRSAWLASTDNANAVLVSNPSRYAVVPHLRARSFLLALRCQLIPLKE